MLFGSAIFIFTLFNIIVLSFCFICDWIVINQNSFFCVIICDKHVDEILCGLLAFHVFSTSCTHHFTAGLPSWSYRFFYSTDWHRNTSARAYLSWTWVCWHSLIIYVLCCCTCPNTTLILTMCFTFVCVIHFSFIRSYWIVIYNLSDGPQNPHLVIDLNPLTHCLYGFLLNMSTHYL